MQKEIFVSSVRSTGDLAGVFEYDGETGYFYLYRAKGASGKKIMHYGDSAFNWYDACAGASDRLNALSPQSSI
jgi:hypothetical protein